jgi:hypothetical protein
VIHHFPCFREWLITHLLLAFLPFLCLFTDSLALRLAPCSSLFLWYSFSILLLCCPCLITVCSLLFSFVGGESVCPGAVLVYVPMGGLGIPAWCMALTCLFCQLMCRRVCSWWQW